MGGPLGQERPLKPEEYTPSSSIVAVNTAASAIFVAGGATLDASQETARDPDSTLRPLEAITEHTTPVTDEAAKEQPQAGERKTGS